MKAVEQYVPLVLSITAVQGGSNFSSLDDTRGTFLTRRFKYSNGGSRFRCHLQSGVLTSTYGLILRIYCFYNIWFFFNIFLGHSIARQA